MSQQLTERWLEVSLDTETKVLIATSRMVPGLVVEATTFTDLGKKIDGALAEWALEPCKTCGVTRIVSDGKGAPRSALGRDWGGHYCPDCT